MTVTFGTTKKQHSKLNQQKSKSLSGESVKKTNIVPYNFRASNFRYICFQAGRLIKIFNKSAGPGFIRLLIGNVAKLSNGGEKNKIK